MARYLPSIWLGEFRSKAEYDAQSQALTAAFSVYDWIDDRLLYSRHPLSYPAYCVACEQVTQVQVSWALATGNEDGSVHPAWTETGVCPQCKLNSRARALVDLLKSRSLLGEAQRVYLAEQTTPLYRKLRQWIPSLVGSEYLGPDHPSGTVLPFWRNFTRIRHEDLTALSFPEQTFHLALTLDVFEHIPNYRRAFAELWRVLKSGGSLVFTIPFFPELDTTRIRASIDEAGAVVHHHPPEIHGNPVDPSGSLCFQNFGWDILATLRDVGFADAVAHLYWGPWQGHLGFPFFVFQAFKA